MTPANPVWWRDVLARKSASQHTAWPDLTYLWWPRTHRNKTTALVPYSQHYSLSGICCVNICEKGNAKCRNGNLIHRFVAAVVTGKARAKTLKDIQLDVFLFVTHTHTHTYLHYINIIHTLYSAFCLQIEGRQLTQICVCCGSTRKSLWGCEEG